MNANCICVGVLTATTLLSHQALAGDHAVTVRISVSTRDVDLSQPAGLRRLYGRLRDAARIACGDGNRLGLAPVDNFTRCFEKALGEAVRSVNRQRLTQLDAAHRQAQ